MRLRDPTRVASPALFPAASSPTTLPNGGVLLELPSVAVTVLVSASYHLTSVSVQLTPTDAFRDHSNALARNKPRNSSSTLHLQGNAFPPHLRKKPCSSGLFPRRCVRMSLHRLHLNTPKNTAVVKSTHPTSREKVIDEKKQDFAGMIPPPLL